MRFCAGLGGAAVISFIDIYSISLLLVSLTTFVIRYTREEPPVLPYLVIACTCAVSDFLGDEGGGLGAVMLLIAATFLFMGCVFYPRLRKLTERGDAKR